MSPETRFLRIDGLTVFAAFAFVAGLAGLATLDRVGAPQSLVSAGGPILALFGFAAFGLSARNADLSSFVAARQRLSAVTGGLSATAIAAGVLFCLSEGRAPSSDPPTLGLALGLALGALLYAPLLRRFGATSPADVVATRYPYSPPRILAAAAIWSGAALTAFAGFRIAVEAFDSVTSNRLFAEVVVAAILVFGALPGGLTGVAACAAASGAALVGLAACGYAWGFLTGLPAADVAALASALDLGEPAGLAPVAATALASAAVFASAPPSAASRSVASAVKAGAIAVAICLALAAAAGGGTPAASSGRVTTSPVAASLLGATTVAGALSLALLGAYQSSRALGLVLAERLRRFGPIPSVRLARMRAAELIVLAGCAVCDSHDLLAPRAALAVGMALMLAFAAPMLALSAIPRVGPLAASVGALAAVAVSGLRLASRTALPNPTELFETALLAAAAAFTAGALTCLVLPTRELSRRAGPVVSAPEAIAPVVKP